MNKTDAEILLYIVSLLGFGATSFILGVYQGFNWWGRRKNNEKP